MKTTLCRHRRCQALAWRNGYDSSISHCANMATVNTPCPSLEIDFVYLNCFSALSKFATWRKNMIIFMLPKRPGGIRKNQYSPQVTTSELLRGDCSAPHQLSVEKYNHIWSEHAVLYNGRGKEETCVRQNMPMKLSALLVHERSCNTKRFILITTKGVITHDCFSANKYNSWPWVEITQIIWTSQWKRALIHFLCSRF